MKIEARLVTAEEELRQVARIAVDAEVGLREHGATGRRVHLVDVSTHGFRIEGHDGLPVGTQIWLKLPGVHALNGRVAWARGDQLGGRFVAPLDDAVLARLPGSSGQRG